MQHLCWESLPDPPGGVRSVNSLDQEYRSFLSTAQVWYNIRGLLTDTQMDAAMNTVLNANGTLKPEDTAKARLGLAYPTLPSY